MKTYEVLALTNGYFQVMANTQDNRYWVPVGWEVLAFQGPKI